MAFPRLNQAESQADATEAFQEVEGGRTRRKRRVSVSVLEFRTQTSWLTPWWGESAGTSPKAWEEHLERTTEDIIKARIAKNSKLLAEAGEDWREGRDGAVSQSTRMVELEEMERDMLESPIRTFERMRLKKHGCSASIKHAIVVFTDSRGENPEIYFSGFERAFFNAGEELDLAKIQRKLIQYVNRELNPNVRDPDSMFTHFVATFIEATETDSYEPLIRQFRKRFNGSFLLVKRAWKNANSAEIILTTSSEVPTSMWYPFCKPLRVDGDKSSDFACSFQLDAPRGIDFHAIENLIGEIKINLKDKITHVYVGYLSSSQAKLNIYYPRNGGENGQVGIIIVPKPELYEQFERMGSIEGFPLRIPYRTGNVVNGFIPVLIENPKRYSKPMV